MKTSKSQQEQTRRDIIRHAVDLITELGYDGASMKQIARAAGIGDATIYKYFANKEKIVLAYYELVLQIALELVAEIPGWDDFSLQERLQALVDALLEILLADREFVEISRDLAADSPLLLLREQMPMQQQLKQQLLTWINAAEARAEIPPCDFKNMIAGLFLDYLLAVLTYWLKDDSEEFSQTTQLVDLTLGLLCSALASGVLNKVSDLLSFLLRNQLHRAVSHGEGLLSALSLLKHSGQAWRQQRQSKRKHSPAGASGQAIDEEAE